ncbi:MAG TPA: ATP-binding protein [Flavipsychrobacter sp.]|nr:ATP-binding protein [Flavipsychrobacter sp.]
MSLYALRLIRDNDHFSKRLDHANAVISELYKIDILIRDIDAKERGYGLTKQEGFIGEIKYDIKKLIPATQTLGNLIADQKDQKELLIKFRGAISLRLNLVEKSLKYYDTAVNLGSSPSFQEARDLKNEALMYLKQMQANEFTALSTSLREKDHSGSFLKSYVQTLIIIFFLLTSALFTFLVRQINIRKKYQDALQQNVNDLKGTNAELEQIAHALSHELQEPVRKIQLFSDKLLHSRRGEEETGRILQRINVSAKNAHSLLQNMEVLIGLKKEDYGNPVDLNMIMQEVVQSLHEKFTTLKVKLHSEKLPSVRGNHQQLVILFTNLLENSLNFASPSRFPEIEITCQKVVNLDNTDLHPDDEQEYNKILIKDNGQGFENSYSEKIFRMFQRLQTETEGNTGKGIGLALCRKIMNNHYGQIKANGKPNEGATFTLYFPAY